MDGKFGRVLFLRSYANFINDELISDLASLPRNTLCALRQKLLMQPEPVAKNLALSLELFTEGSLDVFSKPTNIRTNSRILSYDISGLSLIHICLIGYS